MDLLEFLFFSCLYSSFAIGSHLLLLLEEGLDSSGCFVLPFEGIEQELALVDIAVDILLPLLVFCFYLVLRCPALVILVDLPADEGLFSLLDPFLF